ncbi:MAG: gamma-glutamyltransferase [Candidatus Sericytochromatia bacterium]|nr:gamma-glutamyltransferase [Candidatus Sericytochromatia bacterium]
MKKPRLLPMLGLTFLMPAFVTPTAWAAVSAPISANHGMVASDHRQASEVGANILKQGGNAIDAAIATSLALSVLRNQSTGIGGGGFMLIRLASGETAVLDYREVAPAAAHQNIYLDPLGNAVPGLSTVGYKAVGVPGLLAGLQAAHKRYGSRPLKTLFAPAINLAEKGFVADAHFREASEVAQARIKGLQSKPQAEFEKVFFKPSPHKQGYSPYLLGEKLKLPDLAKTLRTLADKGISDFYTGGLSRQIVAAMQANGGLISAQDLANYRVTLRQPLKGDYRGHEILTMPPPSSGGTALIETLNLLEPHALGWNSSGFGSSGYVHSVTEALKHAFADRAEFLGDPAFVQVPLAELTSKNYALSLQKRLSEAQNQTLPRNYYGKKGLSFGTSQAPTEDHGTTHFSVMDRFGNVVAATETVNTYFGSLTVVPGTGILLNNQMDDFSSKPGVPNAFGLIGNFANAIAPGKKPLSSMTPTIVLKGGKPFMAVGASGGPRIITGTLHTILNVIDFGMNVNEAVSAPRFHHQWVPETLFIEKDMPLDVRQALTAKGHTLQLGSSESTVQAILAQGGRLTGASDPRKGGMPAGH